MKTAGGVMVRVPADVLNSSGLPAARAAIASERAHKICAIFMQTLYCILRRRARTEPRRTRTKLEILVLSLSDLGTSYFFRRLFQQRGHPTVKKETLQ